MMKDSIENRVRFKIGEIEFQAEGSAEIIERERSIFMNELLPAAVDAIVRTRGTAQVAQYIEQVGQPAMLLPEREEIDLEDIAAMPSIADLSRISLSSFLSSYGELTDQDFILFAAYFDEIRNRTEYFTKIEAEKYYGEARRSQPSNISMCLNQLVKKGLIIDATDISQKSPKPYRIAAAGIDYIKTYVPKDKKVGRVTKSRISHAKRKSEYATISCDDLNLEKYPEVKTLKTFKEKMMLILYIVTNEEKGEWFTVSDVLCLMTDIFGEAATEEQVKGVFKREKLWFKTENIGESKKLIHRKLLNDGKKFVKSLSANNINNN